MKYLKEYGLLCLKFILLLLLGSGVASVLYYFFVSKTVVTLLSLIYSGVVFFSFGYKAGKKASAKGFIAGLKFGGLFVLVLFLCSFLVNGFHFTLFQFLYYLALICISVVAATIGINKKK